MPDDKPLDLLNPASDPEASSPDFDPNERPGCIAVLIPFSGVAVGLVLLEILKDRTGGIQILAVLVYTFLVPYIASDRFLKHVPWDSLMRGKVVLAHCLALTAVYGITTEAFAVKARLPVWFITSGRRPAPFLYCLALVFLSMAFWEFHFAMKSKDE